MNIDDISAAGAWSWGWVGWGRYIWLKPYPRQVVRACNRSVRRLVCPFPLPRKKTS